LYSPPLDVQRGCDVPVPLAFAMELPNAPFLRALPWSVVQDGARPGLVFGAVLHALGEASALGRRVGDGVQVPAVAEGAVRVARALQVLEARGLEALGPLAAQLLAGAQVRPFSARRRAFSSSKSRTQRQTMESCSRQTPW